MADTDDEITVTLPPGYDDDATGGAVVKVETAEKKEKVEKPVAQDDPIADLKGQFANMQTTHNQVTQRLATTEQRLGQTEQELAAARKEVVTSQIDTMTSALEAAEAEAKAAEAAYTAAFEAGDGAAQARANRQIAAAESKIWRFKEAQEELKDRTQTPVVREREPEQRRAELADPVEKFTAQMAPRAAAWIRAHPDCVTDGTKNAEMMKQHYQALADGIVEGGDEYFAKLDKWVSGGSRTTPQREDNKGEAQTTQRRPSAPVAPAGNGGGGGAGSIDVQLTKGEATSATDGTLVWNYGPKKGEPIGLKEMALRKLKMTKDGQYDKTLMS